LTPAGGRLNGRSTKKPSMKINMPSVIRLLVIVTALCFPAFVPKASAVITTYSAAADLYTLSGTVTSLTNRLLVGGNDVSYATFSISGLNFTDVTNATFGIYLVNNGANTQTAQTLTLTIMTPASAASMSDGGTSPALSSVYTPGVVSGQSTTLSVSGSSPSQYFTFNVTSLVTAANTSGGVIGFAITGPAATIFRFTDRDPANDSVNANAGFAETLIVTTIPEPTTYALCGLGASLLVIRQIRKYRRA